MIYPKIYLAIDNCFGAKRWNVPSQWIEIIKNAGVNYVELSADNDCDPLFMGEDYLKRWVDEVGENCAKYNLTVSSMYSGHGTYATLGLGHPDESVRSIMRDHWLKPMMDNAAALGAGFGFYCHAFSQQDLQEKTAYDKACSMLHGELAQLIKYADDIKLPFLALEQMYTPHQPPWTIQGCMDILSNFANSYPLYITLDTGHQSMQSRFSMPDEHALLRQIKNAKPLWLGAKHTYDIFYSNGDTVEKVMRLVDDMRAHPWLFASPDDTNYVTWFERLARYSPIVHLQQCRKDSSPHWPFTGEYNAVGIVDPVEILLAIKHCYESAAQNNMPLSVDDIYLTLEIFSSTAATGHEIIKNINESVEYWRRFVPKDGLRLNELLDDISVKQAVVL